MSDTPDIAASEFQAELNGILHGLVRSVNEEASGVVTRALAPLESSHLELKTAAMTARQTVQETSELVATLQETRRELANGVQNSAEIHRQLTRAIAAVERSLRERDARLDASFREIEQAAQRRMQLMVITTIVCALFLAATVGVAAVFAG